MNDVAALFVLPRSYYKKIPGVDCYDEKRDARNYRGKLSVIAHPPCRFWCRLAHMAKPEKNEYELGIWAAELVTELGGVLEQPAHSRLFKYMNLPYIEVKQIWWNHLMVKPTWLYFSKCEPGEIPFRLVPNRAKGIKYCSKQQAMHTPKEFAEWLVKSVRGEKNE